MRVVHLYRTGSLLAALICSAPVMAQADAGEADSVSRRVKLVVSGYAELYAQYNTNRPADNEQPVFIYSHHRLNELAVNLAYLKLGVTGPRFRANAGLAAGTYVNRNLATEPATLQHIWEANAGYQLHPRRQLWLDAGVFLSHIGFEQPAGKECLTLTRSLVADNSPYYESGVRLSYQSPDERWYLAALALNGWQRIQRIDGNSTPAGGLQVSYQANAAWKLNYSNFIGNVYPDSTRRWRQYHNVYADYHRGKLELMLGADVGLEQAKKGSGQWNRWLALVAIGRYQFAQKWFAVGRAEYFDDPQGVAAQSRPGFGFVTAAFSAGADVQLTGWLMARAEAKQYLSQNEQFPFRESGYRRNMTNFALALTVGF